MTLTARLRELALAFLKLGFTAFGGPAAHIGLMEREFVRRRAWLTHAEFLDLLGAVNLIPGPNSTEMAIHLGHRRAGRLGLVVAGVCFMAPAVLLVAGLAWAYLRFGTLPAVQGVLAGVKPVVLAVVVQALVRLGRTALKTRTLWAVALAAAALNAIGVNEIVLLAAAGALAAALRRRAPGAKLAVEPVSLFLVFLKIGSVLYGSGYVLLAFLRSDLVVRLGWLTEKQLLDAVAVGQVTPGPVFTTATFVGYVLAGPWGAAAATVGIFLPAFVFVALSAPWVPRLRQSAPLGAALDAVNAASLALMAVVAAQLGAAALTGWWAAGLGLASAVALVVWKVDATWLIAAGAAAGWAFGGSGTL